MPRRRGAFVSGRSSPGSTTGIRPCSPTWRPTLDIVSGGRLELGIGAGWNEEESGAYGIALGSPETSAATASKRHVRSSSAFSRDETTSFRGPTTQLTDARCNPKPIQRPHPPICIGGNGEKRTLRTAARFAQHWNFVGGTVEEFARKRDVLREHCSSLGRDPEEILLSSHVRFEGDPVADCRRRGGTWRGGSRARHRLSAAAAHTRGARAVGGRLPGDELSPDDQLSSARAGRDWPISELRGPNLVQCLQDAGSQSPSWSHGALANEIDGLRRALGAKALERIAPHCTLIPPVQCPRGEPRGCSSVVRNAAAKSTPIAVTSDRWTTFWPRTPVLYLAVNGDIAAISALRENLGTGPLAPPSGRPGRQFVPHLTLDQRIDPGRLAHALEALADYRASYCFERVTVLDQDADHRWQPLADAALGRPAVAGRGSSRPGAFRGRAARSRGRRLGGRAVGSLPRQRTGRRSARSAVRARRRARTALSGSPTVRSAARC